MGIETVSLIIAAFVSGSLGVAALMRNFRSRLCIAFSMVAGLLFAHDALGILESFEPANGFSSPRLHLLVMLLLSPSSLLLLGEFLPRYRRRLRRIAWSFTAVILGASPFLLLKIPTYLVPISLLAGHLSFLFCATLWLIYLWRAASAASLTRERIRFRYAWWGGVITVLFFITNALHFSGSSLPPLGTLARALYFLFLFQTFIQKELITAEEVTAKVALFSLVALMLSVIYSMLVSWVGDERGLFFFNTFIASFVILVLFEPIRSLSIRFTRKLFLRRNSMLEEELQRLSHQLMGALDPIVLARRLGPSLGKSLGAESCAVYLVDRDGLSYLPVVDAGGLPQVKTLSSSSPLVEYMMLRRGRPFVLETIEIDRDSFHSHTPRHFCQSCLDSLREIGADFVIPFLHEAKLVGFAAVSTGEREPLSNEQLRLFLPLARQIALLLRNAEVFDRLRDREKLAALGEMAAGLAHEIKNPLGAIKGAAELLREDSGQGANAAECVRIILDETGRLSGVLSDFLDYAKPRRSLPQVQCHPLRVVEHTAELIRRDARIQVEIETDREDYVISADPEALKQILLNLFLNAVQAMHGFSARPVLRVRLREIRPRRLVPFADSLPLFKVWEGWNAERSAGAGAVPFLEIEVIDNGPGIDDEDLARIFVPFFTTKPQGTGLGLAICQRLVEGMGGTVRVGRNVPTGSVFTIHLPIHPHAVAMPVGTRGEHLEPGGLEA